MSNAAERFFVVTGGPGAGKSTLLGALETKGFGVMPEAGRGVIKDQVAIGGRAVPWSDPALFAELMLSWDLRSYQAAKQVPGMVFFDRGVVDVAGYLKLVGKPVPDYINTAVRLCRYNHKVFVAPPWEEIFARDMERKQDFAEAVRTYEALISVYAEHGYELLDLPRVPVEERARFVVEAADLSCK